MTNSIEIKSWINEVRLGKKFSEESILVMKHGAGQTRVTLLDIACCKPFFIIEKEPGKINKEDIEAKYDQINHHH